VECRSRRRLRRRVRFGGSPRVLGIEDDREVLTFIAGTSRWTRSGSPGTGTGSLCMPGPTVPCVARRTCCVNKKLIHTKPADA